VPKKNTKIKQNQAKSERGFRPSPHVKSSNTTANKRKNKQSQGESEQGFRPSPHMKLSKNQGKSR